MRFEHVGVVSTNISNAGVTDCIKAVRGLKFEFSPARVEIEVPLVLMPTPFD